MPAIDERDWRGIASIRGDINEEALAVGRDGVLPLGNAGKWAARNGNREESRGGSSFEWLTIGRQLDRRSHHFAVRGDVEDFPAILVPSWLCAAACGDLKLSALFRKWPDIDLKSAGFIRLVSDLFAVGGELALTFFERSLEENERFLALPRNACRGHSKDDFDARDPITLERESLRKKRMPIARREVSSDPNRIPLREKRFQPEPFRPLLPSRSLVWTEKSPFETNEVLFVTNEVFSPLCQIFLNRERICEAHGIGSHVLCRW
jgi:hypothetical protein